MERHLRVLSPCKTAIPPITLPAAPTLFQSTFNFSSYGGSTGGQAGFARPPPALQCHGGAPPLGCGGDPKERTGFAGSAAAAVRTWMRPVRVGLPYRRRDTRRAVRREVRRAT